MVPGLPNGIGEAARMACGQCICDRNGMATKQLTRSGFWQLIGELSLPAVSAQKLKRIQLHRWNKWAMTDIVLDFFVVRTGHGRAPIHGPNPGSVKSTAY